MAVGPFPHAFTCSEEDAQHIPCCFFLDFFLHIFGLRFAINCSSHVRPLGPFA
jgi:hypothetical protein